MYLKKELYELIRTDESIFDFIQEVALDGLWYWDLENPENEYLNAKFWTVLGYNPDEMPHKSSAWQGIINQDDLNFANENFTKHCENPNHPYDQVVRYTHKNGSTVWIRCRGFAIRDENGKPIRMLGAHHDITELKQAEEKHALSERTYKEIFNGIDDSLFIHEIGTGAILDVNDSMLKNFGYDRDDIPKLTVANLSAQKEPNTNEHASELIKRASKGETLVFEWLCRRKDGDLFYTENILKRVSIAGVERIMAIVRDITERKRAEEALRESAENTHYILKHNPNAIAVFDNQMNLLIVSDRFLADYEVKDKTIIGKNHYEVFPEMPEKWRNVHQKALQGEVLSNDDDFFIRPDGSITYTRWECRPWYHSDNRIGGMIAYTEVITERKQAEQELLKAKEKAEESEAKINSLFATMSEMVVLHELVFDENGEPVNYRITDCNDAFTRITGISRKNAIGRLSTQIYGTEQSPFLKEFSDVVLTGETCQYETYFLPMDKHFSISAISLKKNQFATITTDITERKRAEEELHKSNQRLESLLEISHKVTSTIDQDMIMQMIVNNAIRLIGLDTGAIYLKSDDETISLSATTPELPNNFSDDLRNAYLKNHPHLNKALQTGKHVLLKDALSAKLTSEEKEIVDLKELRTILYLPIMIREEPMGALVLSSIETPRNFTSDDLKMLQAFANQAAQIIDNVNNFSSLKKHTHELEKQIKQREKAEQELIVAKEKAQESDRLKSAFLANMSHEIRTPMNGILGFSELLKNSQLSIENQQKYIRIIEKSGARMLNILNDIIDISRIEAGQMKLNMKESNIDEQIKYVYTFFKPEAEAKIIKLSYKTPLPLKEATIKTDREKVYAILTNLVKNAIKYTEKGEVEIGYVCKGDWLEFYVKDTGIGIPRERQEAIFKRFVQADIEDKMAHQGAGLGLAISKAYVEMLGGEIQVESEQGKGSIFYFTLPYNAESETETTDHQLEPSGQNDDIRKLKILMAEDDEVSELLLDETVKMFSKEIVKARTGVEAVEACQNNPDIDLVLMDIQLPEMGGYEATQQIREFNKEVIIIAQTAYGLMGDREKSIDAGCNDYISKPIKNIELQALIHKYFGE